MRSFPCLLAAFLTFSVLDNAFAQAHQSARYGGWSREPLCQKEYSTEQVRCVTVTLGHTSRFRDVADIAYYCDSDRLEGLSIRYQANFVVNTGTTSLEIAWDGGRKQDLNIRMSVDSQPRRPIYFHHITDTKAFVNAMARSRYAVCVATLPALRTGPESPVPHEERPPVHQGDDGKLRTGTLVPGGDSQSLGRGANREPSRKSVLPSAQYAFSWR